MMTHTDLETRVQRERELFNNEALKRSRYVEFLQYTYQDWASQRQQQRRKHYMHYAHNQTVLEIGSASWRWAIDFDNACPQKLICTNLSETEVQKGVATSYACERRAQIEFAVMDAHRLGLPTHSVDFVYANHILHHLDLETGLKEMYRVLKPEGRALFIEPLLLNPVASLVRWLTPHLRTPDERALGTRELDMINSYFYTEMHYFQLFSVPTAVLSRLISLPPKNLLTAIADKVDQALEMSVPVLRPFYRFVMIYCSKKRSQPGQGEEGR